MTTAVRIGGALKLDVPIVLREREHLRILIAGPVMKVRPDGVAHLRTVDWTIAPVCALCGTPQ